MKRITTTAALLMLLISCDKETRSSNLKTETGIVVAKQYIPTSEQTVNGTSYSLDNGMTISTHTIKAEEAFMVVFRCDHGKVFTINRDMVFAKVMEGDTVDIDYYETKRRHSQRRSYEFIDANKKPTK